MASSQQQSGLPNLVIRLTTWDDEDGIELRGRQRAEILERGFGGEPGTAPSASDVPVFVVVSQNGAPVACGGLRELSDPANAAEVKRMYTVPEARGRSLGVSDILMTQLEQAAISRGWTTVRLETGIVMTHARKFYERHGFVEIPRFGHYVDAEHSICYEKVLNASGESSKQS